MQAAALQWASDTGHDIRLQTLAAMATARQEQHEYARSHFKPIVRLGQPDGVFEPRPGAHLQAIGQRLPRLVASREIYMHVWWPLREERLAEFNARESARVLAQKEKRYWTKGQGRQLTLERNPTREDHMLPL